MKEYTFLDSFTPNLFRLISPFWLILSSIYSISSPNHFKYFLCFKAEQDSFSVMNYWDVLLVYTSYKGN